MTPTERAAKVAEIRARPRISASARQGVQDMAEACAAIGNKEDRLHAEALNLLLREHDRAHQDHAALLTIVAELEEDNAKLRDALLHISNSHLGDCPAAFDELAHAKTHIVRLRKRALDTLNASERTANAAS